jgi:hypothetical protein
VKIVVNVVELQHTFQHALKKLNFSKTEKNITSHLLFDVSNGVGINDTPAVLEN